MRKGACVVAAAAAAVLGAAATAAAAEPAVVQSWSVERPAYALMPDPGGGAVAVGGVAAAPRTYRATAFRVDGRRLWQRTRRAGCGSCDGGPHPLRLQPDGTYGPIGPTGDDAWAYDRAGREVPACAGAVAADGSCATGFGRVLIEGDPPAFLHVPVVRLSRAGAVVWETPLRDMRWTATFDVPAASARDEAGGVYAAFDRPRVVATGEHPPGRLVRLDAADGTPGWAIDGPVEVLAGLRAGVLARDSEGLVAVGAGGRVAWSRVIPDGAGITPGGVRTDARRNAVYVEVPRTRPRVVALTASTGRPRWATPTRDRARLLATGAGGRVYIAADAGPRRGLVALAPSGRALWRLPAAARVVAAAEIARGRVAVLLEPRRGRRAGIVVVRPPR